MICKIKGARKMERELEKIINLDENKLLVLAGRPSTGKSSLALKIATNKNISTAIFSLEMSKETILSKIKSTSNIFINDTAGISINQICEEVKKIKKENNIKLVIIDYLQLVSYNKTDDITKISTMLKSLVEELNITIIVISQLSKAVDEREDKRPTLEDFKQSKAIVQKADIVMALYKKETLSKSNTEIIILKKNQELNLRE